MVLRTLGLKLGLEVKLSAYGVHARLQSQYHVNQDTYNVILVFRRWRQKDQILRSSSATK